MKNSPALLLLCSCILGAATMARVQAQLFWDGTPEANGLGPGGGTWGGRFWNTNANGNTDTLSPWVDGSAASFRTTGTNAVDIGGGTINLSTLSNNLNNATGATTTNISNGTLNFTGATITNNAQNSGATAGVITFGADTTLRFNTTNFTFAATSNVVVRGTIATSASNLIKTGTGTLTLEGANNYTGTTTISGGLLRFGTASNIPTGLITINSAGSLAAAGPAGFTTINGWLSSGRIVNTSSGSLAFGASGTINENIDLNAAGYQSLFIGAATGATVTYTGTLTHGTNGYRLGGGGGTLNVSNLNSATSLTTASSAGTVILLTANTYTGPTVIGADSTLRINNVNSLGSNASVTVNDGGALQLNGSLNMTGKTLSLKGSGPGSGSASGALRAMGGSSVWNGDVAVDTTTITRISADSGHTLTFNGNLNGTGTAANGITFQASGTIRVNGSITGEGVTVTKSSTGAGVLILNGENTYTGTTTISNGTVQVGLNGTGSIASTVTMSNASGVLAGTGTVKGRVNMTTPAPPTTPTPVPPASAGTLSAGDTGGTSVGTLTLEGGLTLNNDGGNRFRFDVGTNSDRIVITGGTFVGSSFNGTAVTKGLNTVSIVQGAGFGEGVFDLIDWTALIAANVNGVDITDFTLAAIAGFESSYLQFNATNNVLQLVVVPEPSRGLLLLGAAATLLLRRRRVGALPA